MRRLRQKRCKKVYILTQNQGVTIPGLEMPCLNNYSELPPLPPNNDQLIPTELETPAMATALEENTSSPTRHKIPHDRFLQAGIKPTNEPKPRGEEEEAYSTKAKYASASRQETSIIDVSQETQDEEKNSKVDDNQKEKADKTDSTKDTAVSASTKAPCIIDAYQQTQESEREIVKKMVLYQILPWPSCVCVHTGTSSSR
jgi:hypothetical protein